MNHLTEMWSLLRKICCVVLKLKMNMEFLTSVKNSKVKTAAASLCNKTIELVEVEKKKQKKNSFDTGIIT